MSRKGDYFLDDIIFNSTVFFVSHIKNASCVKLVKFHEGLYFSKQRNIIQFLNAGLIVTQQLINIKSLLSIFNPTGKKVFVEIKFC